MDISKRLKPAAFAASTHLAVCVAIAALVGFLVFGLWYPYPYRELSGGRELFMLVVAVDVVCGPLLTLVLFNPKKSKKELCLDIGLVIAVQLSALGYGLWSVAHARPVWLALEGNRFRVVSVPDIDAQQLPEAAAPLQHLPWTGPKVIGVRLAKGGDPDYLQSIEMAMKGVPPAFRPERWVDFDTQRSDLVQQAKPLADLSNQLKSKNNSKSEQKLQWFVSTSKRPIDAFKFLPLAYGEASDWIVVIDAETGEPQAYLPIDGW
jgi:hypothetical protein